MANQIIIHILSTKDVKAHLDSLLSYIDKERKDKSLSYLDVTKQYQSIGLGYLLKKYTPNAEIKYNSNNKPYKEGVYFNGAHSNDYIVLAINDTEIGIDIEQVKPVKDNLIKRVFSQSDQSKIKDYDSFFKYWTIKEAIVKADGTGFTTVDIQNIPCNEEINIYKDKTYHIKTIKYFDYYISLASLSNFDLVLEKETISLKQQ